MTIQHDKVDVLIIGSGASGAAVAWSLADTQHAHPLPGAGRLGEARPTSRPTAATGRRGAFGDFDISPNRRGRDDRLSDQRRQLAR